MDSSDNIRIDDQTLVRQCRSGDMLAAGRLITKYQKRVYNTILKICANREDAAELTQDTFVKVLENINRFEGKSSFYTWLYRIAVNLTINHCRRSVKLGFTSLQADQQSDTMRWQLKELLTNESAVDPATIAANNELCELLTRAMMQLDEHHRTVLVLRDMEGLSYDEIADVLDIELGTVKSRLSRARRHLHDMLEVYIK